MDFVNFFANIGIPTDPVANENTLRYHIGRIPYNTFQVSPVPRCPVLDSGGGGGGVDWEEPFFFVSDGGYFRCIEVEIPPPPFPINPLEKKKEIKKKPFPSSLVSLFSFD